jgi:beta-aspartyl-peptidase (threonine type)
LSENGSPGLDSGPQRRCGGAGVGFGAWPTTTCDAGRGAASTYEPSQGLSYKTVASFFGSFRGAASGAFAASAGGVQEGLFAPQQRIRRRLRQLVPEVVDPLGVAQVRADPPPPDRRFGTVGAVAVRNGHLAAGTSTGGLVGKLRGRVAVTAIIGGGTYAADAACGVSCTGTGEVFIRHAVAHDVVARMLYGKCGVSDAARCAINQLPDEPGGVGA